MDDQPTREVSGTEPRPLLAERIREQYPNVFVTLISVLVGLVFQDLVQEARARMQLWPLDLDSFRTWCQLLCNGGCTMSIWVLFSHISITRRHMPTLGDSFVAMVPPLLILAATTFVGRAEVWPWFYMASLYLFSAIITVRWNVRLALAEPALASLARIRQLTGVLLVPYFGVPFYAIAGWADQQRLLPPWLEVLCVAAGVPGAMLAIYLFFRDWRRAIAVADAEQPDLHA
jgi:hypothetical protein